ncbi:hypothetical protein SUGI_0634800 [Cryptomeria japonica]|uniref:transcription factor IBH1-like 1 n=1 Tax=Cryptomeria japonica TaxID=3369 RepID=UPI002414B25D|nr:transcription factor IBH1-like 1 [Cryptomeria japonica]GLJ31623.1 hypothetical protein SUGI_0634800 [Cryptomeria japonica]
MERSRARVFLSHLLPALKNVTKRSGGFCTQKRKEAIRMAADISLAQTASEIEGSEWSRALNLRLHRKIMKQALTSIRSRAKPVKKNGVWAIARRLRVLSLDPKIAAISAVERKVRALQRLVPGGREMKSIDLLFQETADYIVNLQMQVHAMQALADFCPPEFTDRCVDGEFHKSSSSLQLCIDPASN